jgi:hypothetical protein
MPLLPERKLRKLTLSQINILQVFWSFFIYLNLPQYLKLRTSIYNLPEMTRLAKLVSYNLIVLQITPNCLYLPQVNCNLFRDTLS